MTGLDAAVWKSRLIQLTQELGSYRALGKNHFATFIQQTPTLLVTFETVQGIRALSSTAQPFGFDMVRARNWSHLCIISNGDTWFRDPAIYAYFDELIDEGFFDEFQRVLFYGAGPCGYAAAAYSVASPGSTVVVVQPQATLDARLAEWDPRFPEMRRTSFRDRFGYAPDMLDAAQQAFVLYDPREEYDAMHAALFARSNVTRLRLPFMGAALQTQLMDMEILYPLLTLAGLGKLDARSFYRMYRARRDNVNYLRNLMGHLDKIERPYLNMLLCRNVITRKNAPKFRRRLDQLEKAAEDGEFDFPADAQSAAQ
ncbi:phosphoadenosine phosphosulfate reductase [Albibacillus kandeliae]|uniref:phosphoadenosine phosphosulfate reductase n=1 Tax=Albibacillus kandeliae TaxID=2174228 RepID=UPI001E3E21EA|nr:phosphoadenosine phosphosulfate reductase [Albibacillus kandeliae]